MISAFGVVSLVVFLVCCVGLVLHFQLMKRRERADKAIQIWESMDDEMEDKPLDDLVQGDAEAALREYNAYISRFPGIIMAKILGFTPL
ncbi:MAG: LemA family protein [Defluviitaleaceae bacterium]|nr:LemA family protein [Defluviitaleaceae bacterium]MCL2239454.1 LemA family protein [Defluviitaleaceae bacterium]